MKGHKLQLDAKPAIVKWQLNNYLQELEGLQLFYLYEALMDVDAVIADLMYLSDSDRLEFISGIIDKKTWYLEILDLELSCN